MYHFLLFEGFPLAPERLLDDLTTRTFESLWGHGWRVFGHFGIVVLTLQSCAATCAPGIAASVHGMVRQWLATLSGCIV